VAAVDEGQGDREHSSCAKKTIFMRKKMIKEPRLLLGAK